MGATQAQCSRLDRAGPYLLGELDARTRLAYERHVKVCPACREEVDLLARAAEAMPLLSATPQAPDPDDPHLHRHAPALAAVAHASAVANAKLVAAQPERYVEVKPTLQAIPGGAERSEQFSPAPLHATPAQLHATPERPRADVEELRQAASRMRLETAALRGGWTPKAARVIAGGATSATGASRRRTWRGSRWRFLQKPVPGPAVVGFLAVAIVAIATVALSGRIAGIRYERAKAGWKPGGAAVELAGNQLELLVERMPRPAPGHGYQVWVLERATGQLVPTRAWLDLNKLGDAGVNVPGNYHDWNAAVVYVERLRGHESTRSGAVVVADLRHVA